MKVFLKTFVFVSCLFICNPAYSELKSTFDTGTDNWRKNNDVTISWQRDEGNPGGFLKGIDWADGRMWSFVSPISWGGNWQFYTTLFFDLKIIKSSGSLIEPNLEIIKIFGNNGKTLSWKGKSASNTWTHYKVPLNYQTFGVNKDFFNEVISNVKEISINGEFISGDETGGLDNVLITEFEDFIINLNARTITASNPIVISLENGVYNIIPIGINDGGLYNAWNAWGFHSGCDNNGICSQGWMSHYMLTSESLGELHLNSPICYSSSVLALSKAEKHSITLNTSENINFYIPDCSGCFGDNTDGLSFRVELIERLLVEEDFEDNELHSDLVNITTKGSYTHLPDIKDIEIFGSNKAFGFGRSDCNGTCLNDHITSLFIFLSGDVYVSKISFKDIELYDNWGGQGQLYIDGILHETFGKKPTNDHKPDTTYRKNSILVNQTIQTIEFRVWDITSKSEIYIDDIQIYTASKIKKEDQNISITSPQKNSIVIDSTIIVNGVAKPKATIDLFVNNVFNKTCTASTTGLYSFSDIKLNEGQNELQVRLNLNNSDGSSYSETYAMMVTLDSKPKPPEGIIKSTGDTRITISWNPNKEIDLHGYNIYRDNKRLNSNTISSNSFTDYWLINGKEYKYIVTSVDSYGSESLKTSVIKAVPVATYKWTIQ